MKHLLLASALTLLPASAAPAGDLIRNACLNADRPGASRQLCSCIQKVADQSLKRRDQKLAASFFSDPHKAQVIRQSDRPANEVFWARYKEFGNTAEQVCADIAG